TTPARWRRYSAEACTSDGGSRAAARTASRTASGSAEAGRTTSGTAPTQPSAMRRSPFAEAAALTMQVPSLPMAMDAKPSWRPGAGRGGGDQLGVGRHRADPEGAVRVELDAAERRDPVQVDEHVGRRGPRLHHVDQRLPAGERARVVVLPEEAQRLLDRRRSR